MFEIAIVCSSALYHTYIIFKWKAWRLLHEMWLTVGVEISLMHFTFSVSHFKITKHTNRLININKKSGPHLCFFGLRCEHTPSSIYLALDWRIWFILITRLLFLFFIFFIWCKVKGGVFNLFQKHFLLYSMES